MGVLGLVVSGFVDGDSSGESGVGGSESVVAWSVVGLGGCLVMGSEFEEGPLIVGLLC